MSSPPSVSSSNRTLEQYASRADGPLLVLALLFLLVLAAPILDPTMPRVFEAVLSAANVLIWAVFAVDYLVRLRLVDDRVRYVRTHLPDLAAVLFPALRPLRLLRLFTVGNLLARRARGGLAGQAVKLVTSTSALLVFVGAVAMLDVERDAEGANITTPADAFWWACTTITTVGYGDRYPVTTAGRVIAVLLMVFGIALVGVLTASIAAWFVHVARDSDVDDVEPLQAQVRALEDKVDVLLARLPG